MNTGLRTNRNVSPPGLFRSDLRLIRAIVAAVSFAFFNILALNSAQNLVEQHQVLAAESFGVLTRASSQISTSSQRVALLLFAGLNPPRRDLQERLLSETAVEITSLEGAAKQLTTANSLKKERLIHEKTEKQLILLKDIALQFAETAKKVSDASLKHESSKELVAQFAEQASNILSESRKTIETVSNESVRSALYDQKLRRNFLLASSIATIFTGALVLIFIVHRLRRELRLRRRTEAHLRHTNDELENFSAIVAHDLKGPLSTIGASAELLRQHLAAGNGEPAKLASIITQETDRLRQMIQALLQLSRVTATQIDPKMFNVRELLKDIETALGTKLEEEHAKIVYEGVSYIRGDKTLLGSLFQNLIENSIKYKQPDTSPKISISGSLQGEWVRFVYIDNGIGISPELRGQVFEPFVRAPDGGAEGLGLGLAVVKRIVEAHGGKVSVLDLIGPGAKFEILISRIQHG